MKTLIACLYKIYQLLIAAPIILVATILTALTTTIGTTFGNATFWSYYPGMIWSRIIIRVLLLSVRIEGRENMDAKQSYVIVANHQGAFDIFLIYGYINRPFKWMMKQALRSIPLVGKACESAGFIFVDKSSISKIQHTYEQARKILKDGISVVIFPEGSRTYDGSVNKFQRGAFQLACELGLPLLPVTINGSFTALPRTKGLGFVERTTLSMQIHPAIAPTDTGIEHERQLMDEVHQVICSGLK